jgi:hypothetical protein
MSLGMVQETKGSPFHEHLKITQASAAPWIDVP